MKLEPRHDGDRDKQLRQAKDREQWRRMQQRRQATVQRRRARGRPR